MLSLRKWGENNAKNLMHTVLWYLHDTAVHLPTSLPSIKIKYGVYDLPVYNYIRGKEIFAENLSHLSGASSEPLYSLIRFFRSDTTKVDPGGEDFCAAPG